MLSLSTSQIPGYTFASFVVIDVFETRKSGRPFPNMVASNHADDAAPMTVPIVPLDQWRRDASPGLPQPLTALVGRERQVAEVRALLAADAPLVTVTGPAGVGKTRFALAVGHEIQSLLQDGAALVSLVGVSEPAMLPQAIARGLSVRDEGDRPLLDRLTNYLCNREMLLLIDNFEHLIEAAPLVSTLLAASPRLRMLVTSSMALRVQGEHEYSLEPLSVPPATTNGVDAIAENEAVRLFVQRATAVRPDFALTAGNAATIAAICERLDGLPLAIELAAARSKVLSPSELLDRLEDRFQVLVSQSRDVPARQQTLRNAIEWNYNLLQPDEQALFRALSVFSGGWTLEAAEAVCSGLHLDVLEGLSALSDQSLVRQREQQDGRSRFVMLGTLREYAAEQLVALGEEEQYREAHAGYFEEVAMLASEELLGAETSAWLDRLDHEHDNFRAALEWSCRTGNGGRGLNLGGGLWRYWQIRGYVSEGRRWMEMVASLPGASARTHSRCNFMFGLGRMLFHQGEYEAARASFREAGDIAAETGVLDVSAGSHMQLGSIDLLQGDLDAARQHFDVGLAQRREQDDEWGTATAILIRGRLSELEGNLAEARAYFNECLAMFRGISHKPGEARALYHLGNLAREDERLDEAVALYQRSLETMRANGDREGIGLGLLHMSLVLWMRGEAESARLAIAESVGSFQELGTPAWIAACFEVFALIAADLGQPDLAVRISATAAELRSARQTPIPPAHRDRHDRLLTRLRQSLGNEGYVLAWERGRHMSLDEAVSILQQPRPLDALSATDGQEPAPESLLTRREIEILILVADGLSNQEIATQLYISPRTTTTHISNILRKLGVSSRTAAVAAARRQGVLG